MTDITEDFDKLLEEVRKTIRENDQFLKGLADDKMATSDDSETEQEIEDEDFEEL